jgi:hypothetical protein
METTSTRPSTWRSALTLIVAIVIVAAPSGVLAGLAGLSLPLMWVITFPTTFLLVRLLLNTPEQHAAPAPAGHRVIVEAAATGRRWMQVFGPLLGTLLLAVGVAMLVRREGGGPVAVGLAVAGVVLLGGSLLVPIVWTVDYKGHQIRFDNYPCLAERLFIDGTQVARGGFGVAMVLRGRIPGGDGAGDEIVAASSAGVRRFSCRITAGPVSKS